MLPRGEAVEPVSGLARPARKERPEWPHLTRRRRGITRNFVSKHGIVVRYGYAGGRRCRV